MCKGYATLLTGDASLLVHCGRDGTSSDRPHHAEKVVDSLAMLTLHADRDAAMTASNTLYSLMYCRPGSRNVITHAMVNLVHRVPLDHSPVALSSMDLLISLMTVRPVTACMQVVVVCVE